MIEIRDLVVRRGAALAVDRVSFDIRNGEWTGVAGANGSGKTSLLRALAGRLDCEEGAICFSDEEHASGRLRRAARIGFAPDQSILPATLSGAEFFAICGGGADSEALAPLRRALDFNGFIHSRIGTLSAGMRQRLAVFSAFLREPRIVALDEPFNWLDPVCAFDAKEALRSLVREQGLTLVTALHEMATLVHCCQAGILMSGGRMSRRLDAEELAAGARDYAAFEAAIIRDLRSTRRMAVRPQAPGS